jgi:hypothetical protein
LNWLISRTLSPARDFQSGGFLPGLFSAFLGDVIASIKRLFSGILFTILAVETPIPNDPISRRGAYRRINPRAAPEPTL